MERVVVNQQLAKFVGSLGDHHKRIRRLEAVVTAGGGAIEWEADGVCSPLTPTAELVLQLPIVDPSTLVVTGDGQRYLLVSDDMNGLDLVDCDASLSTATTSGTVTVQLRRQRAGADVDMLSTGITIDATEKTSYTAAVAAVINTANDDVLTGDLIFVDVDVAGSNGKGLVVVVSFA